MAGRTVAKTSLVHRFTQVLFNSGEGRGSKEERPAAPTSDPELKSHRLKLEEDVQRLEERLQQETDLHSALESAIARAAGAFPSFPRTLPVDAQELLADIAVLEVAVSNLEEQVIGLKMQIRYEWSERLQNAACHRALQGLPDLPREQVLQGSPTVSPYKARDPTQEFAPCESNSKGLIERVRGPQHSVTSSILSNSSLPYASTSEITGLGQETVDYRQDSKVDSSSMLSSDEECSVRSMPAHSAFGNIRGSVAERMLPFSQPVTPLKDSKYGSQTNMAEDNNRDRCGFFEKDIPRTSAGEANPLGDSKGWPSLMNDSKSYDNWHGNLDSLELRTSWRQPNRLSQEMVSCMIGIYCHLADPSEVSCKPIASENVPSPKSPLGHVASSSFSSLSELSSFSFARTSPLEKRNKEFGTESSVDPYRTHDKLPWADIGTYSSAVQVSWMSVGKEQLEYAADALRIFRSLVEQLSKVDTALLGHQEKLAFWINVYNALMMHAYLAYGVPKNDSKFFALMQKAAYTVGGHSFNAMTIEHLLLRGKAPSYRPQIALLLALHKVKIPEGVSKFAINRPEPLVTFALSCGACSSPAVRIYTAENVHAQLQSALHDYVRASVAVTAQGKVLVPKLLHSYARDLVQRESDQESSLVNWVCGFLPAQQATIVRDALQQQQRRRGLPNASANFTVVPFDFRLRYLFLVGDKGVGIPVRKSQET